MTPLIPSFNNGGKNIFDNYTSELNKTAEPKKEDADTSKDAAKTFADLSSGELTEILSQKGLELDNVIRERDNAVEKIYNRFKAQDEHDSQPKDCIKTPKAGRSFYPKIERGYLESTANTTVLMYKDQIDSLRKEIIDIKSYIRSAELKESLKKEVKSLQTDDTKIDT